MRERALGDKVVLEARQLRFSVSQQLQLCQHHLNCLRNVKWREDRDLSPACDSSYNWK